MFLKFNLRFLFFIVIYIILFFLIVFIVIFCKLNLDVVEMEIIVLWIMIFCYIVGSVVMFIFGGICFVYGDI